VKEEELSEVVLSSLSAIAPEVELAEIDPGVDLREQIDIDSMDLMNFMVAIHETTGVDIPEVDYPKLATVDGCVEYLAARIGEQALGSRA
jgi:acyl carrier protein